MVTNYTPDKCRYTIGKLVKSVWLISENAIKDIRIDNGEAWVNSISETPIRIDCTSVGLQEEESLDERYRFVHTLTFSVNGYANGDDFQGKYYAIVKDNNGTYWLVNPLFPCKVTYVYTLSNDENHTDFTLSTASNHPVLRLNGMVDARAYECKEYFIDGISELWLNEKRYSVHDGKYVKYTNDGFKVIDYNKNSATFTETFDGTNTSHSISFDVLFSSYKSSWHYNLLEFIDECIKNNNLYSAIIKTRNGKYAMCGFSYGLQPSFNITADDTTQEINKVQISLQDVHTVGDPIDFYNSADYTHLTAKTWVYTAEHNGYECVGDGLAKYLLQKEVDALGNDTCNYKALAGYENNFPELNIVGTFNGTFTFPNNECKVEPCRLSTSLPRRIVFNNVGSKTYTVRAGSDWTIAHDDGISVTPSSGSANQSYTITVYNSHTPTAEAWITNLTVSYCDGMEYSSVITVVEDEDSCFQNGSRYNISANEHTLTIPTQCCINSAKERTGIGTISTVYNDHITVYVPENNTGAYRTIVLLVELCDGGATNITIVQSDVFEKWEKEGTFCNGTDKYEVQRLYTGTTSSSYTMTETTRNVFVEAYSLDCKSPDEWNYKKWEIVPGDYVCDGETKYAKEREYVSDDNVRWIATDVYRKSNTVIEDFSTDCGYDPSITGNCSIYVDEGDVVCSGYNKYKYLRKYVRTCQDCDNCSSQWIATDIYEIDYSQVVEYFSSDCGYICGACLRRWVVDGYSCVGYDKYRIDRLQISHNGGITWVDTTATSMTMTEQASEDCGCSRQYRWEKAPADDYVCDMETHTKYYKEYCQVSCDGETWENLIPESSRTSTDVIEYNSEDCGGTPIPPLYGQYFTLVAKENGTFRMYGGMPDGGGGTIEVEHDGMYSLDSGETWYNAVEHGSAVNVSVFAGQKVMMKGTSFDPMYRERETDAWFRKILYSGRFDVEGNILSITYGDNFIDNIGGVVPDFEYYCLFSQNANLESAENMVMPVSGVGQYSCTDMFALCSLLTKPPLILPATTLGASCYKAMFNSCVSLEDLPELPATTLADDCYGGMFGGCSSLEIIPSNYLPATTLAFCCYCWMFDKCTSLVSVPSDLLPATTLADYCYQGMFSGCHSLTTAPVLPAPTLVTGCYSGLFQYCISLTSMTCLATAYDEGATNHWTLNVEQNGTFTKRAGSNFGYGAGVPYGWTIVNV